jgi:alkylated DNA repair dioxygenase AlkB
METLFPIESKTPPGFSYFPDFITIAEERSLIEYIEKIPLEHLKFQGFEAKRLVKSFGLNYHFDQRSVTPGDPIPADFSFLIEKVAKHVDMVPDEFAELLVTEYPIGSVINWHRDGPPFKLIAGISLLAGCNFRFRPYDKTKQDKKTSITVPLGRRSLYIIEGTAREDWEHSITPVKQKRYSITLRTLR